MREWRNWQTRTFEGRVVLTIRVQVPFLAPARPASGRAFFINYSVNQLNVLCGSRRNFLHIIKSCRYMTAGTPVGT